MNRPTPSLTTPFATVRPLSWLAVTTATLPLLIGTSVLAASPTQTDWPQWRGPVTSGVAPKANPPTQWSDSQNVRWKIQVPGRGTGTPIIIGNQIFLQAAIPTGKKVEPPVEKNEASASPAPTPAPASGTSPAPATPQAEGERPRGDRGGGEGGGRRRGGGGGGGRGEKPSEFQQFALLAYDRTSGALQWQKSVREEVPHEGHHPDHGFASHTPLTDGELVFGWFGSRGLHCFDTKGNLKWQKDLGKQRTANGFGEGNSPALHGNILVVNWDHEGEDFIVAFDKTSGRELWRTPREEKTTWTTPFIVTHEGKTQVVVCASNRIRSYELETGKQLWECGGMTANVIPTPVSDFGFLYAISGFRGNALLAIQLGKSGDLTDTDAIAWRHAKSTPYVPSPLLYGQRLYFTAGNNAILSCFDAKSGKALYTEQRVEGPGGFYASPVAANGRVYLVGRNGTSVVLKDSDQYEVIATNTLADKFDASPAIAGNDLFLRGHQHLYCIGEK